MKKLIVLTCIFSFLLSSAAYSQWQLIVSAKPDRDITPADPSDPDNGIVVREKILMLSVADEKGAPVQKLSVYNFRGFCESCDEFNCPWLDMYLPTFKGNQSVTEVEPGLYIVKFRIKNPVTLNHTFIKVYPTVKRIVIGGVPSKAQLLF